jgi:predicted amidohydrolase YtcJ
MRIIYHAKIYTFDAHHPLATALAIDGDRVIDIGDDSYIINHYSHLTDLFDAGGSVIIPGLADAHMHLEQYAFNLQKVDCDTPTRQDCLARIEQRAATTAPGEWILGHGWNQNNWLNGFGNSEELDLVAPNQPVYLTAKSLHAAWASSAALSAAGITKNSPDPAGGKILRSQSGHPSGILLESAMQLVTSAIPMPKPEQRAEAIRTAISRLSGMGLTSIHDFDQRDCLIALQLLHDRGDLNIRVLKSIPLVDLPHAIAIGLRTGFGDLLLRLGGVKVFTDGALGPRTAAMLQPYNTEPDNLGLLLLDSGELLEIGRQAIENGLSLAVHAIGDRANREVLDAFAQLKSLPHLPGKSVQSSSLRHRIEHVQLIHPSDVPRLAELGVIASMQPLHATSDMDMANHLWGDRSATAYAWNSLLEQGAVLAFGSDAPVEEPDPFAGLHAAVTRRRADGAPGPDGWYPSQRLSRQGAFQAYTHGPAFAAGLENQLGRLSPGYLADLLVLEQDPFNCDISQLRQLRPTATMLGGNWVYQA